ncbi:MAG: tetratricopeptide repeat protein [Deltaproteobacteria bacterium]|nr:tetratricopeptide repeat protein [Deltaproteobacteria bacterium]
MGTIKIGKLIYPVVCLVIFISVVNCYCAEGKAEEFFKQGEKNSTVENADSAIFYYSEAIKINPEFVQAYNNRGIAYVWKKKYDLAIADFSKAIELDPEYGKAYNNRAIVYTYEGETDKARQDLYKAQRLGIAVDPKFLKKIKAIPSTPESIFHKPAPYSPK